MAEKENGGTAEAAAVVAAEREELPKSIVRRLVKDKLSQFSTDCEMSVLRESLLAFSESSRIFIHYLSATANDVCKDSKRQTISAEDVFKALEEIQFTEFVRPLRASLEEFRQKKAERKSGVSKASNGKGKRKEPAVADGEDEEDGDQSIQEFRQKNPGKRPGVSKESNKKAKRKEQPADEGEDKQDGDKSDESEDSANDLS